MGFRTVCIENRSRCSYSGGYMVVTQGEETTKIHLSEIASLILCTTQVYVSAFLMSELAKAQIPVVFSDEKSFPVAESLPLYGAYNCPAKVAEQLEWSLPSKKRLWQHVVCDKIAKQAELLEFLGYDRESSILRGYAADVRSGDLTNREAAAAALYFPTIFGKGFSRDQDSPINASLNYGYSIVLSKVSREIVSHGYLTQCGVSHHNITNQWNFSCDLMEPFRPLVDKTVALSGVGEFGKEMRRLMADIMNQLVPYDDGSYKVSSVISLYIQECMSALNREISFDDIKCFGLL